VSGVSQDREMGVKVLELVTAWLSPRELAALARTCHVMAASVRSLTRDRVADAAQGLELGSSTLPLAASLHRLLPVRGVGSSVPGRTTVE
jgi:hypothetical protein